MSNMNKWLLISLTIVSFALIGCGKRDDQSGGTYTVSVSGVQGLVKVNHHEQNLDAYDHVGNTTCLKVPEGKFPVTFSVNGVQIGDTKEYQKANYTITYVAPGAGATTTPATPGTATTGTATPATTATPAVAGTPAVGAGGTYKVEVAPSPAINCVEWGKGPSASAGAQKEAAEKDATTGAGTGAGATTPPATQAECVAADATKWKWDVATTTCVAVPPTGARNPNAGANTANPEQPPLPSQPPAQGQ